MAIPQGTLREIELKRLLPGEEALRLLVAELEAVSPPKRQINTFFDTSSGRLARARWGVRLREEEGVYTLTAKGPPRKLSDTIESRPEIEKPIEASLAHALLAGRGDVWETLSATFESDEERACLAALDAARAGEGLSSIGGFANVRRSGRARLPSGRAIVVELDTTEFPNGSLDYEVEIELEEEAWAIETEAWFEVLARRLGIETRPATPKLARFFASREAIPLAPTGRDRYPGHMTDRPTFEAFADALCIREEIDLVLDLSRMGLDAAFFARMKPAMDEAYRAMDALEAGAIANPDEKRRVGHYWLRAPERAPEPALRTAIESTLDALRRFVASVHEGRIRPERAERFENVLVVGIGGSALGPQLVADALGDPERDRLRPYFLDNTDPAGMDKTLRTVGEALDRTLVVTISKSGGTPETRNGMLVTQAAYREKGLTFARHAVAVTGKGSKLDQVAESEGWLARFEMWDWVGGRTSETSAVGLLPAALQGIDIEAFLEGARRTDEITRGHDTARNPAALLALAWHGATGGKGEKDMVVLPYKDSLLLLSRYLQQLVMESLGKELDLEGRVVHQGISVYGNKGSTDQHAYVQQLRDGVPNFFVNFIEVIEDGGAALEVEPGITSGDYLRGFLLGTREALWEANRPSLTLSVSRVDAFHLGVLIALYERAVGFYASLVGINAYHQPGVEAGKKAAASVLSLQARAVEALRSAGAPRTSRELAEMLGDPSAAETLYFILRGLADNGRGIAREGTLHPLEVRFRTT